MEGSARMLVTTGVSNEQGKVSQAYDQGTDKFIVDTLGYLSIDI